MSVTGRHERSNEWITEIIAIGGRFDQLAIDAGTVHRYRRVGVWVVYQRRRYVKHRLGPYIKSKPHGAMRGSLPLHSTSAIELGVQCARRGMMVLCPHRHQLADKPSWLEPSSTEAFFSMDLLSNVARGRTEQGPARVDVAACHWLAAIFFPR